jgi:hypothetical protein
MNFGKNQNSNPIQIDAMKNQSEMIQLNNKPNVMKNRSFRKDYTKNHNTNFNLYGMTRKSEQLEDIKKKFNLTGELKFDPKSQKSSNTENKFYKSKNKKQPKTTNIYDLLNQNNDNSENSVDNQPIQLLKTRSKNSSFVKKKVSSFNTPLDKKFEIKLYEGILIK